MSANNARAEDLGESSAEVQTMRPAAAKSKNVIFGAITRGLVVDRKADVGFRRDMVVLLYGTSANRVTISRLIIRQVKFCLARSGCFIGLLGLTVKPSFKHPPQLSTIVSWEFQAVSGTPVRPQNRKKDLAGA